MGIIYFLGLFFFSLQESSQTNKSKDIITEAHLINDTLKVLFRNKGKTSKIVPALNYRTGYDKKNLYEKFYHYSEDTLFIILKKEIDKDLYTIKSSHKLKFTEGKLYYVDHKLQPKRSYWTSVRLNKIDNFKTLVLQFEGDKWICSID